MIFSARTCNRSTAVGRDCIRGTAEQGLAGRQADPCRLAGCGRIAGGLGQRFAQGGRFVQFARGVAEIGQVIAHRVVFFRRPLRGAAVRRSNASRQYFKASLCAVAICCWRWRCASRSLPVPVRAASCCSAWAARKRSKAALA